MMLPPGVNSKLGDNDPKLKAETYEFMRLAFFNRSRKTIEERKMEQDNR